MRMLGITRPALQCEHLSLQTRQMLVGGWRHELPLKNSVQIIGRR
jgi:hypothetical protein